MKRKTLCKMFVVFALLPVLFYLISCRPDWSPDSKKIASVYSYKDKDESEYAGVAIYDVENRENKSIMEFVKAKDGKWSYVPINVFWLKNGDDILFVSTGDNDKGKITISKYNLKSNKNIVVRNVEIPGINLGASALPILLEKERWFWFYNQDDSKGKPAAASKSKVPIRKGYYRIDSRTGKVASIGEEDEVFFTSDDKNIYFVKNDEKSDIVYGKYESVIGFIDKKNTLFKIPQTTRSGDKIMPVLSTSGNAFKFAYIKNKKGSFSLAVVDRKGIFNKEITIPEDVQSFNINTAYSVWDTKGKTLWIMAECISSFKNKYLGLLEINTESREVKLIKLLNIYEKQTITPFQLSLSPDSKYIAMNMFFDKKAIPDTDIELNSVLTLYLINLNMEEDGIAIIDPPVSRQ